MASQFGFLLPGWPELHAAAARAEALARADARASAFHARRCLELLMAWVFQADARLSSLIPPDFPPAPEDRLPLPLLQLDRLAADDWKRLEAGKPLARQAGTGRQWRMALAAFRHRAS